MSWGEAIRLTQTLQSDPSSHVAAALNDWDAPRSGAWMVLADLYDLMQHVNVDPRKRSQVKPYPRPWRDPNSRRRGRTTKSRAEVISILRAHGHVIEEAGNG
jgi:hypothetical protein